MIICFNKIIFLKILLFSKTKQNEKKKKKKEREKKKERNGKKKLYFRPFPNQYNLFELTKR